MHSSPLCSCSFSIFHFKGHSTSPLRVATEIHMLFSHHIGSNSLSPSSFTNVPSTSQLLYLCTFFFPGLSLVLSIQCFLIHSSTAYLPQPYSSYCSYCLYPWTHITFAFTTSTSYLLLPYYPLHLPTYLSTYLLCTHIITSFIFL
ncbi:hypothetical protein F5X96DRAFT_91786 [Biscogniauxia mediterranea]|nr:hypothetical protein F5X96DRAFT_91786 [Biscogniauxia mediterranea]